MDLIALFFFLHHTYLNFSFKHNGVKQSHFEGGCFKTFGAFLGRFEGFVWGHLLGCIVRFSVFLKMSGVLVLKT